MFLNRMFVLQVSEHYYHTEGSGDAGPSETSPSPDPQRLEAKASSSNFYFRSQPDLIQDDSKPGKNVGTS